MTQTKETKELNKLEQLLYDLLLGLHIGFGVITIGVLIGAAIILIKLIL